MIRSCHGLERVSYMINKFSSNLNTVNLHLKIKFFYEIKVLIVKKSQKLCNVQTPLC